MTDLQKICRLVDAKAAATKSLSDTIWLAAECNWRETKSADACKAALRLEGFSIEENPCGMQTAFVASFGDKGPLIAFLGEYDALPALSQAAGEPVQNAAVCGGAGHGRQGGVVKNVGVSSREDRKGRLATSSPTRE